MQYRRTGFIRRKRRGEPDRRGSNVKNERPEQQEENKQKMKMRKRFPMDKWSNSKWFYIVLAILLAIAISSNFVSSPLKEWMMIGLTSIMCVFTLTYVVWSIVWQIKNPYKPERCDKCGYLLPEKFLDD